MNEWMICLFPFKHDYFYNKEQLANTICHCINGVLSWCTRYDELNGNIILSQTNNTVTQQTVEQWGITRLLDLANTVAIDCSFNGSPKNSLRCKSQKMRAWKKFLNVVNNKYNWIVAIDSFIWKPDKCQVLLTFIVKRNNICPNAGIHHGQKLFYLSLCLTLFQWKTLIGDKTVRVELVESQA